VRAGPDAAVIGSYYGKPMFRAEQEKRIAGVPYEPAAMVWTAWDLGIRDATAIWFAQVVGREIRIIDYYESAGVDLGHYPCNSKVRILSGVIPGRREAANPESITTGRGVMDSGSRSLRSLGRNDGTGWFEVASPDKSSFMESMVYVRELDARPYVYAGHIVPHDAQARELGTGKSRLEVLESLGLRNITIAPLHRLEDGINAVRVFLPKCWFDKESCRRGIDALKLYRSEFDDKLQALRPSPIHDWTSHAAAAGRSLRGPCSILDVDEDAGFSLPGLGLRHSQCERRVPRSQRPHAGEELCLLLVGPAAFDLAGVDEPPVALLSQVEAVEPRSLLGPSQDHERLALLARRLGPGIDPSRLIPRVLTFRVPAFAGTTGRGAPAASRADGTAKAAKDSVPDILDRIELLRSGPGSGEKEAVMLAGHVGLKHSPLDPTIWRLRSANLAAG